MTTNNDADAKNAPWWERLTDSSTDADSGRRTMKLLMILAVVILIGVSVWNFMKSSDASAENQRAEILEEGLLLLPDRPDMNYGSIPDITSIMMGQRATVSSAFLRSRPGLVGRDSVAGNRQDPEAAKAYKEAVEVAIQDLKDKKSEFPEGPWEARYLHTLQQLHFFAALNSSKQEDRLSHLNAQIAILDDLKSRYGKEGLFSLKPIPAEPEKTVLDFYYDAGTAELAFWKANNVDGALKPDQNLKIVIELENGKVLELETFSQIAPVTLANFLNLAKQGMFDGTAFFKVDADAGTFVGGSPYSRLYPDRKFIWGLESPGYVLPMETSALLPTDRGAVSVVRTGIPGHGLFFKIHTVDADVSSSVETVFAKVTKGLDGLAEWLTTEVHDEAGLTNDKLPRVRLGIKKITVTGTMDHPSDDSWKPKLLEMNPGPETAAEKAFMEKLKAVKENKDKDDSTESGK